MSLDYTEDELAAVINALDRQQRMLHVAIRLEKELDPGLHAIVLAATDGALVKAEREYNERFGGRSPDETVEKDTERP